jgi:transposase InsO family protein
LHQQAYLLRQWEPYSCPGNIDPSAKVNLVGPWLADFANKRIVGCDELVAVGSVHESPTHQQQDVGNRLPNFNNRHKPEVRHLFKSVAAPRENTLAMQRRRRKRFRAEARVPLVLPTRANEMWTMDYTHDELAGGRKFRTLNLMDGYTREALRIEPDTSLPGLRVVRILESLRERRGTPAAIQVDNGTEFTSRVVDQWAYQNQVALHFIERGKPTQNAFIESFNGKFRDECLNQNWFVDLQHAREVIEAWRVDYNTVRPHSSLRYLTPEEFAASAAARPASPPTPVVSMAPALAGSDVQEPRNANL